MTTVRCAIYTRKSSEEGLQQDFNSLDAQREACAAYILSQASEGWVALPAVYDDGGLSGGTLERPALQRLLKEVAAGRVDTVVVYKVDRLTRSLSDFSKLVEVFDAAGTSFVSVTQSFNTTTSMGRLTLNMLLSFAQFEREVTAERIRDKIAASKAKGMWMGGVPPLGYAPHGRSLKIVEEHASLVRDIFERYLRLGNVRHVADELRRDGVRSPDRTTITGKPFGGVPFSRGQIYSLLKCATYVGEVHHNGAVYAGLHDAIIDRDTWECVQARLADNVRGHRSGVRAERPSLLAGKVFDETGAPLVATHACKGKARYRYYVSRALQAADVSDGWRVPARELEALVATTLAERFDDALTLAAQAGLCLPLSAIAAIEQRGTCVAVRLRDSDRPLVQDLVARVRLSAAGIEIACATGTVAELLGTSPADGADDTLSIAAAARLTRTGRAVRLVRHNASMITPAPDPSLVRVLIRARGWWDILRRGDTDIRRLAAREGVTPSYLTRVARLAFLSPAVVDAILDGTLRAGVDAAALTAAGAIEADWEAQRVKLLPARAVR